MKYQPFQRHYNAALLSNILGIGYEEAYKLSMSLEED